MLSRVSVALALLLLSSVAQAQVPAPIRLDWVLPTQNTDSSAIPATGANALAKVEGWISTGAIPDAPTTPPTFTLTPVGVTTTQTVTVPAGATLNNRLRVCNFAGICSVLTTNVPFVTPGQPRTLTNVTIQVVLTPP
jgi:hypothetical protein